MVGLRRKFKLFKKNKNIEIKKVANKRPFFELLF